MSKQRKKLKNLDAGFACSRCGEERGAVYFDVNDADGRTCDQFLAQSVKKSSFVSEVVIVVANMQCILSLIHI